MADVNDPQRYERKLGTQLAKLYDTKEIDHETRQAIKEFTVRHYRGLVPDDQELSLGSLLRYVQHLRFCAESIESPLTTDPMEELNEYLDEVKMQYAATTHNGRVSALHAFATLRGYDWDGSFEFVSRDRPEVNEEKVFEDDEINAMLEAADSRERVMVSILADLGCRIGALCSFRVGDLDLSGAVPKIRFNSNAHTKGADGSLLLTWAAGHIENYLGSDHPYPENPDAPLIHVKEAYAPNDPDDDGALTTAGARQVIKSLGKDAGIRAERVKPHNFRHTAVSDWIRQGFTAQQIVKRASWAGPEMLEIYENITDEMAIDDLAVDYELADNDDIATDPSEVLTECPRCETPVRKVASFCGCCHLDAEEFEEHRNDEPEPVTLDDPSPSGDPGVPDDVWADGYGDLLDDIPNEVLIRKLAEKADLDPSDLVDE